MKDEFALQKIQLYINESLDLLDEILNPIWINLYELPKKEI